MRIRPFKVEQWISKYEEFAKYNIAETCANPMTLDELFQFTGEDKDKYIQQMFSTRMTYGHIEGSPEFREGVSRLFKTVSPDEVLATQGAIAANYLLLYSLVESCDEVISVLPTYQQLYSIPESFGATVKILPLNRENDFLPDVKALKTMVNHKTKLICINNPNNPSGKLIPEEMLREIVEIARGVDAYLLCDEVYRGLNQEEDCLTTSIVDLYEKGISVGSMSKIFSLAGLRMGWIVSRDKQVKEMCMHHRDYNTITCGVIHDMLSSVALKHADKMLARNRALVRKNLSILEEWVNNQPKVTMFRPQAGTTAMLYYDLPIDCVEFCRILIEEYDTLLTPGTCFEQEKSVRIGYACSEEELRAGLAKVDELIKRL